MVKCRKLLGVRWVDGWVTLVTPSFFGKNCQGKSPFREWDWRKITVDKEDPPILK